ncbi:MCP four helix bundle domain-containing protein [Duganella sp. sic0402]|uniref:methyl-accepting chemotaxis protein n=1 Tax=Duganella sp. sic0402 TaxID=2854786 RepID=UPI001C48B829|nr:methyl-accepting chemotaxis protein [Duganella sp. sic0402]MBV7537233.1 MCP four helix bundle domain-containing protein [Duganella sp. sic0402]
MKFSNLKIGVRLATGFGLLLLLLGIVATVAITRINSINDATDRILNDRFVKVMLAKQIQFEVNVQARNLRNAIIGNADPEEVRTSLGKMDASVEKNSLLMADLKTKIHSEKGLQLFAAMLSARQEYANGRDTTLKLLKEDSAGAAGVYLLKEVRGPQTRFFSAIDDLTEFQTELMRNDSQAAERDGSLAVSITVVLAVLSAVAAVIIGIVITRSITGPVNQAVKLAQTVAAGDLSSQIEVHTKDEIGVLLSALKQMNTNLQEIVGKVRTGTGEIAVATGEVADGNLNLSSRTEQQASALEETASSMEELTSTVKQNSDNARQANQLAVSAAAVARKGGSVVADVVATMSTISGSAGKMADIISVIDGIAFQTNILALNAAVEAARAGEQGRGFAVVASEVRNLAQRSAAAAKEIKVLIDDSVDKVEAGNRLVAEAGTTIQEVVSSVQQVTDIMSEIAAASREQEVGIEQINQAISEMDAVTQQNAALVEEAAAATASLEEQASTLNKVVAVFKLSNDTQPVRSTRIAPRSPGGSPRLDVKRLAQV